jgi:hypothetical protein
MKLMIGVLVLSLLGTAQAQTPEHWLTISQGSYHFKNREQYNQDNHGFGFEWSFKNDWMHDTRWVGGRFYNSDRRYSNYAGVIATPYRALEGGLQIQFGALLGVINGYPRAYKGGYFPLLAPVVTVQHGAVGTNVFIIPPFKGIPATAALQLKVGF